MDDDEIMKQINSKAAQNDDDLDNELAGLEAEIENEDGKKQDSDDELANLEKEDLDDVEEEEEKAITAKKPEQNPVPQTQPKKESPSDNISQKNKEPEPKTNKVTNDKENQDKGDDIYPERVENKYHVVNKMNSLGCFEKEKEYCDKIIEFKKKNGKDYDAWEDKKDSINDRNELVMGFIQNQVWAFEMYKKKIKEQYIWEKKLLQFVEQDPTLNSEQKNIIKERVNNRMKIIEDELTKNPDEEAENEGNEEKEKKEEKNEKKEEKEEITEKKEEKQKEKIEVEQTNKAKGDDLYPEKVENKYHSVKNMNSLGVLQKETELCDKIIKCKKEIGKEYDIWEDKKDSIKDQNDLIMGFIQNQVWDFEAYKKKIKEQYIWEKKLLQFVEQDPTLNSEQKNIIKERVNNRMKKIEDEFTKNPDEEAENEENEEKEKKEEKNEIIEKKEENEIKEDEKNEIKEEKEVNKKEVQIEDFEEEPKQEIQKEIKSAKKNATSSKSENPILHFSKEEEKEEIKRLTEIVTERLNEYRAALEYFKTNDFPELQKEAIAKANQILMELRKIQSGRWNEVNEFDLPDPITPEFIYGYDKEERKKKFNKIISEMSREKELIQEEMNTKMEEMKKIPKGKIKQMLPIAKKEMDALKAKKTKYEKIVSLLKEKYQDKWVPAPLFVENEEESSVEKVNVNVPENTLRIIFANTNYIKKKKLHLVVRIEPDYNLEKSFEQNGPGDWSNQIDFEIKENYFKLHFARIEVDIYKHTLLGEKHKGKFVVNLTPLKSHNEFVENECKIELDSKREGMKCTIGVKIRKALKEKEYSIIRKTNFAVTKIYPPFNAKGSNTTEAIKMEVKAPKVTADDLKAINSSATPTQAKAPFKMPSKVPAKAPAKMPIKAPAANKGGENPKPVAPAKKQGGGAPKVHIDKSEFSEEELKDPDCINNLNTLMVLEFKHKKYEDISKKIDGRTPKELMQRIVRIKCKKTNLSDSLGDDIGPEDYLLLIRSSFEHDKKLASYFNQIKDSEKSKLVSERLPLLIKEMEELMKQMPK